MVSDFLVSSEMSPHSELVNRLFGVNGHGLQTICRFNFQLAIYILDAVTYFPPQKLPICERRHDITNIQRFTGLSSLCTANVISQISVSVESAETKT